MNKNIVIVVIVLAIAGVLWLNKDIDKKQAVNEGGVISKKMVELSDDNPSFEHWGKNFPLHVDMYKEVINEEPFVSEFGGNMAYSKLIRYPQLTKLWLGYAFAIDANEDRGHYFVQIDQMFTARNNKDFLNASGAKGFGGQPTACMNCHSGWTPWLLKNVAKDDWVAFNSTKYWTMIKNVPAVDGIKAGSKEHSGAHGGKRMGVTCADCHSPDDMSLRITRKALINALVDRGYEADSKQGIKASREDMRTLVCSQCHVEYYFRPLGRTVTVMGESISKDPSKKWWNGTQKTYEEIDSFKDGNKPIQIEAKAIELVFPWSKWKKGEPFRIEMFDEYYDENKDVFAKDWEHKLTKAPMLKIQHPESELYSSSVHAANGVSCADCHMPYVRKGSMKLSEHNIKSPLAGINAACKSCHTQSEDYLKKQVSDIQNSIAYDLRTAEYAIVSLIEDIKKVRDYLGLKEEYQLEGKADKAKISEVLSEVLELQRKAAMRSDFIGAENSTGFHAPRESARMLLQAVDMSRQAQAKLQKIALEAGFSDFTLSNLTYADIMEFKPGEIVYPVDMNGHKKGDRYYEEPEVNTAPPASLAEFDKSVKPYDRKVLDK